MPPLPTLVVDRSPTPKSEMRSLYYEVEVTREDGTQVDVQLDENFNVVATEGDRVDDESAG